MGHFTSYALVLILLLAPRSFASETCGTVFTSEPRIVSELIRKNKFVTNRDLVDYGHTLPAGFRESLERLTHDQHWIDLGAGKAQAQIDYLKSFRNSSQAAFTTAVAYKLDRWFNPPTFNGKLEIREGAFEDQATATWKKADLITDLFGVISYTRDMTTSLQKTFDLLKLHGELYLYVTPWATQFQMGAEKRGLLEFLSQIPGLRVEGQYGAIKVTKEKDLIVIPPMELVRFRDEAPPLRSFLVH